MQHVRHEKIIDLSLAETVAADTKKAGKTVVTLNGSFDLLHAGHLVILEEAKQQGDLLFIGLNSDTSIRNEKGPSRPLIPEQERAAMLAAFMCVDYVIIIDAPYNEVQNVLIRTIKPHIHVNGSDYGGAPETWIEWPVMQEVGAKGYTVERRPGLSTSDIIAKIKASS